MIQTKLGEEEHMTEMLMSNIYTDVPKGLEVFFYIKIRIRKPLTSSEPAELDVEHIKVFITGPFIY